MKNSAAPFHSLSRRIVIQFCLFTLVLSLVFSFLCFILLYSLEDDFIEREVAQEAKFLTSEQRKHSEWPPTRAEHFTLYFSTEELPADMREQFISQPKRREFYGEAGRHYHLTTLQEQPKVYLVAEVGDRLLVRPIREGVIKLLGVSAIALTIVACIIAWFIGRKTAKPLQQLANLVDGVAPEVIPETFAKDFPNNEIGILARTLESTMGRIKLALSRERNFTRDVSHELRTPVAIIKNSLEVLAQKTQRNDDTQPVINRIANASMQMEQTVSTLLLLAREEHTSIDKTSTKLLPLIEQSILDNSYLLTGKMVEVCVDDNCNTEVFGQSGMLKVLIDNLLSNAFQYTQRGEVTVSFVDKQLIISDTGPGIEPAISANVTEPAVKGQQSIGYGFGLSIVKRLCEHQHWSMKVTSDQGTKVAITLSA